MKLEKFALIAEIVGGIAIVVTVMLLVVEVRGNTDAIRAAAAQAVHNNYAAWYASMQAEPELLGITIEGMKDPSSLTVVEWGQFIAVFMQYTSYMQNAFYQWRDGTLSPELWQGWEIISLNFFATLGGQKFWEERSYIFGETFREYVETDVLTREPPPQAKPWGAFEIAQ